MARAPSKVKKRRIVAAVDTLPRSEAALEAAAELAAQRQAELLALFIEDLDLLHAAALPFAREIGVASAVRRSLDVAAMERMLRLQAEGARRRLAAIAQRVPLTWTFQIARGLLAEELLHAAAEAELVVAALGGSGRARLQLEDICRGTADLLFARSMREIDELVRELRRRA